MKNIENANFRVRENAVDLGFSAYFTQMDDKKNGNKNTNRRRNLIYYKEHV